MRVHCPGAGAGCTGLLGHARVLVQGVHRAALGMRFGADVRCCSQSSRGYSVYQAWSEKKGTNRRKGTCGHKSARTQTDNVRGCPPPLASQSAQAAFHISLLRVRVTLKPVCPSLQAIYHSPCDSPPPMMSHAQCPRVQALRAGRYGTSVRQIAVHAAAPSAG